MKRLAVAAVLVALAGGFWFAASQVRERRAAELGFLAREDAATFVRPHSPSTGAAEARVHVVEFTDPACETCAAFSPIVDRLLAAYPGRVRLVVRYAPFHAGAEEAAKILAAAHLQGRFWETLHLLYATQHLWTSHHQVIPERIWALLAQSAASTGLDLERLRRDVADPRVAEAVRQDLADAATLGVRKTPGFLVNGRPLEPFGAQPLAALIAEEVGKAYGK
jgi:predicted DsbA family dithiol-disulfide isomerase